VAAVKLFQPGLLDPQRRSMTASERRDFERRYGQKLVEVRVGVSGPRDAAHAVTTETF